jgi:hypothetical protein
VTGAEGASRTAFVNPAETAAANIVRCIQVGRFDLTDEKACQGQMEDWFRDRLLCEVSREHRLGPGDIPDFLLEGRIVVECKKHGADKRATWRQLKRYAAYPQVEALVLATGTAMAMPPELEGKPVFVVNLGRAWL